MNRGDIVVFLGPSLPLGEARRLLAARYLPPVRSGDIFRLRRLRPRAIAVIDGLFETIGAVWHKEILFALEDGIPVFGASSMGALRAAELDAFGMIGHGAIFEAYRDGVYTDDDEVALLHGPAEYGYPPKSEAMVNVRATVAAALRGRAISSEEGEGLIRAAKAVFYQDRTMAAVIDLAWGAGSDAGGRFQRFLDEGGYVDQKRDDARSLLLHLAGLDAARAWPRPRVEPAERSNYVLKLHHELAGDAAAIDAPDLPRDERVARLLPALGPAAARVRQLAQLLSMVYAIGRPQGGASPLERARVRRRHDFGLGSQAGSRRWRASLDLDAESAASLIDRLGVINRVLDDERRTLGTVAARAREEGYLLALLRIVDRYAAWRPAGVRGRARLDRAVLRHARRRGGLEFAVLRRLAALWSAADRYAAGLGIDPPAALQAMSDEFRRARGLERREATLAWQRANNLTAAGYEALVERAERLSLLLNGSILYPLGLFHVVDPAPWLADALRLIGVYPRLRSALARSGIVGTEARAGRRR